MAGLTLKTQVDPFSTKEIPEGYQNPPKGGALEGKTLAIKEIFGVKGHKVSFGNPTWLETHPVSTETSECVQNLYDAGCKIEGFVHTDEMTYSIHGENYHYGATLNPVAPDRVPGGSSNGSASAVAMGLVDIALGSDTFGSVRVPSHNQGIFGIKPTQNRIALKGACALGPSLDTVGWFTRDPYLLEQAGAVLLKKDPKAVPQKQESFKKIIIASDYFDYCDAEVSELVKDKIYAKKDELEKLYGKLQEVEISKGIDESVPPLKDWFDIWYHICGYENWQTHKDWI